MPELIAIAAMAENRVIGKDGVLPWHLPADLQFFKRTTIGGTILFGKTTYEGIGRPLPKRTNLVLSRTMEATDGIEVVRSVQEVLDRKKEDEEKIYICGGAKVYEEFFPLCHQLLLTRVKGKPEGDTHLPSFEEFFEFEEMIEEGDGYQIEQLRRL
ncbi:MAG: dihydrofolate reductase [Verrucomicrobiota bacterium]